MFFFSSYIYFWRFSFSCGFIFLCTLLKGKNRYWRFINAVSLGKWQFQTITLLKGWKWVKEQEISIVLERPQSHSNWLASISWLTWFVLSRQQKKKGENKQCFLNLECPPFSCDLADPAPRSKSYFVRLLRCSCSLLVSEVCGWCCWWWFFMYYFDSYFSASL